MNPEEEKMKKILLTICLTMGFLLGAQNVFAGTSISVIFGMVPVQSYAGISLGAGYQFDLSGNDAEYNGTDIGESSFEASIVRIGFNARF
jgi:hypothetical protein